jgi:hypothetical protein
MGCGYQNVENPDPKRISEFTFNCGTLVVTVVINRPSTHNSRRVAETNTPVMQTQRGVYVAVNALLATNVVFRAKIPGCGVVNL